MMNHHEESEGAVAEGAGIFVEVYRSKPVNKLQLSHWTAICELAHSTTQKIGTVSRTLDVVL